MPPAPEKPQMSSIVPRALARRVGGFIERRLPLRWWDALNQFRLETRLIFSRAILLMMAALFFVFSWSALMRAQYASRTNDMLSEDTVFGILSFQVLVLAILLNMNLWEVEREGRTFELLIMRIPNLHRLLWFKLRIALFWLAALSLPFFAAYGWFCSIPPGRLALFFVFVFTWSAAVGLATSVVASFVHHGLTSGVITFIVAAIVMGITGEMNLWYADYYRLFMNPLHLRATGLSKLQTAGVLIANRLVLAWAASGLYWWLLRRLGKSEKWIQ